MTRISRYMSLCGLMVWMTRAHAEDVPLYGQCGGISWTGGTTCAAGNTCVYVNPYYSQCLVPPHTPTPTPTTTVPPGSISYCPTSTSNPTSTTCNSSMVSTRTSYTTTTTVTKFTSLPCYPDPNAPTFGCPYSTTTVPGTLTTTITLPPPVLTSTLLTATPLVVSYVDESYWHI